MRLVIQGRRMDGGSDGIIEPPGMQPEDSDLSLFWL